MRDALTKESLEFDRELGYFLGRLINAPLIAPEHVYFSLTNRCNLNCKICGIPKEPVHKENELTFSQIKDIILQIKDMGIKHIIFSGGEPLLKESFLEIIEFAVNNNIAMVDIITNGILLNDEFIQKLIKARLNHITISLDGLRQANDHIRGDGVFAKVERSIDALNFYKTKLNASGPTLGINFTIVGENIDDILPVINYARAKRCNIVVFQPVLFNNTRMFEKKKNALWPQPLQIKKLRNILSEVIKSKGSLDSPLIYTNSAILKAMPEYFQGKRPQGDFKCYEGIKRVVITFEGNLWSCAGIYGDLKKHSLKDLWFSQDAEKMRKKIKKCRAHCLQDCVYSPSNILCHAAKIAQNIQLQDQKWLRQRLNGYRDILQKMISRQRFFSSLKLRSGLKTIKRIKQALCKG